MAFLLDTNVVCEATAKNPEGRVLSWCRENSAHCVLSVVTLGEIWKGIHLMPAGKRKDAVARWVAGIEEDYSEYVLPLDTKVIKTWSELYARHEARGFNMGILDSLIAATALHHGLTVVTRNVSDFPSDVETFNPWTIQTPAP